MLANQAPRRFFGCNQQRIQQRGESIAERAGHRHGPRKNIRRHVIEADHRLPETHQADEHDHAVHREQSVPFHAWYTPRSSRDACVTCSSNAFDSRVSAVRGHGRST